MKKLRKKEKNNSNLVIAISFFIIIFSLIMIGNEYYKNYKIEEDNNDKFVEFFDIQEDLIEEEIIEEQPIEDKKEEPIINNEQYIGVLEIKKINLTRGFYSKNSRLNNVNKNIQILNSSDMPDIENGNVIIAAHSGNSSISFFRNLPKLNVDDNAIIYYQGKTYIYKLVNNYEIEKTGTANIKRNINKNSLTLITCKHNSNKQLVYIFELINIEWYNLFMERIIWTINTI